MEEEKQLTKFERWKQGMKELSPAQTTHAKLIMSVGILVGLLWAFGVSIYNHTWHYAFLFFFVAGFQVISVAEMRKAYKSICHAQDELKENIEENLKQFKELMEVKNVR
jgi:hypothetical protein